MHRYAITEGYIILDENSDPVNYFDTYDEAPPPGLKRGFFDTPHPFYNMAWNSEIRFLKICAKNPVQILFKFPRNPIC